MLDTLTWLLDPPSLRVIFALSMGGVLHYFYPDLPAEIYLLAAVVTWCLLWTIGRLIELWSGVQK